MVGSEPSREGTGPDPPAHSEAANGRAGRVAGWPALVNWLQTVVRLGLRPPVVPLRGGRKKGECNGEEMTGTWEGVSAFEKRDWQNLNGYG